MTGDKKGSGDVKTENGRGVGFSDLLDALFTAIKQWECYADELRTGNGDFIATATDDEAIWFQGIVKEYNNNCDPLKRI